MTFSNLAAWTYNKCNFLFSKLEYVVRTYRVDVNALL